MTFGIDKESNLISKKIISKVFKISNRKTRGFSPGIRLVIRMFLAVVKNLKSIDTIEIRALLELEILE